MGLHINTTGFLKGMLSAAVFCLLITGCSGEESGSETWERLDAEVSQSVVVEAGDSLSQPVDAAYMQVDSNGNVYLVDRNTLSLKVYGPGGELADEFGGEGRGPGEFVGISGFTIRNDTLFVYDRDLARVSLLNGGGDLLETRTLKGFNSASVKMITRGGGWIMLGVHASAMDFSDGFELAKYPKAHTFNDDFTGPIESFIVPTEIDRGQQDITEYLGGGSGQLLVLNDNRILFAPASYAGQIFEYQRTDEGWVLAEVHRGYTESEPYEILEEGDARQPEATFMVAGSSEILRLILHNRSLGLFRAGEHLFHFTVTKQGEESVFGAEVYDAGMSPIGYLSISSVTYGNFLERVTQAMATISDSDGEGSFYILDTVSEYPSVHRLEVDLTGLPE